MFSRRFHQCAIWGNPNGASRVFSFFNDSVLRHSILYMTGAFRSLAVLGWMIDPTLYNIKPIENIMSLAIQRFSNVPHKQYVLSTILTLQQLSEHVQPSKWNDITMPCNLARHGWYINEFKLKYLTLLIVLRLIRWYLLNSF